MFRNLNKKLLIVPHKNNGAAKDRFIRHYWWVLVFIAICFGMYAHAAHKKQQAISALQSHLQQLYVEQENLLLEKEELLLNIHSQKDPAWIELTLIKGLGLVPDGKIKVYFDGPAEE